MGDSVTDICNYRQAGANLATSGRPTEAQLAAIADAGHEVVVNLALHYHPRYSLADEAATVRRLGVEHVHIPVRFEAPTRADLERFFEALERCRDSRVWLHCAANLRVMAFLGLYRRLRQGWPVEEAFRLMRDVWEPNAVWAAFIAAQLADEDGA